MILAQLFPTRGGTHAEYPDNGFRVCTTMNHTDYILANPHLRALSLFAILAIGALFILLWRAYGREHAQD